MLRKYQAVVHARKEDALGSFYPVMLEYEATDDKAIHAIANAREIGYSTQCVREIKEVREFIKKG